MGSRQRLENALHLFPHFFTATAINDHGWIVGYSMVPSSTGFIWDLAAGVTFINNVHLYDINNSGQITGVIYDAGTPRTVLWNPIPEPSSLFALAAGIVGVGLGLLRRRGR